MNKALLLLLFLSLFSCKQEPQQSLLLPINKIAGKTMGTTYSVSYVGDERKGLQEKIDSLLVDVNQSVSTYIPTSTISKVNQSSVGEVIVDEHFMENFNHAKEIHQNTKSFFNPAIMPLVNYYGFGFEKLKGEQQVDTLEVKRLRELCKLENFELQGNKLSKTVAQSQLDFSAIAKGYGVDQVANLLQKQGIENFLVEIGGEGYAQGLNEKSKNWRFGVRRPSAKDRTAYLKAIAIDKKGIATSGNYENYRELENKQVIGHTIDPQTGFAQSLEEDLLSVTVIANDCMTADAYATAFKAMGFVKTLEISESVSEIQIFLVYKNDRGEIGTYSTLRDDE